MTSRTSPGYIGPKLTILGRLSGSGELQVDGRFEGDVSVDGSIAVGPSGLLVAAVTVGTLAVDGHVRGNVSAEHEVAIREGGLVEGDVRAPCVTIEDGGTLHGGIVMDFEPPPQEDDR